MAYLIKNEKGETLEHEGKEVFGMDLPSVVKGVDLKKRTMTMTGTDESTDRDGDQIMRSGWDYGNYVKNPVFLWAHNYVSIPIAAAQKIVKRRAENNPTDFHLRYPTEGLYPLADMILNLYAEKIINASSVGFIPFNWEDIEQADTNNSRRRTHGRRFTKQELLELSGCAVPANPNAIQNMVKTYTKGLSDKAVVELMEFFKVGKSFEFKNKDNVLNELEEFKKEFSFEEETDATIHQVPSNLNFGDKNKDCNCEEEIEIPTMEQLEQIEGIIWADKSEFEDVVLRPYPNEHACRLNDPGKYDRFARKNCFKKHNGKCIDFIFGIKSGKSEIQALRFPKDAWSVTDAKTYCDGQKGLFEAAKEISLDDLETIGIRLATLENNFKGLENEVENIKAKLEGITSDMGIDESGNIPNDSSKNSKDVYEAILTEQEKGIGTLRRIAGIDKLTREISKLIEALKK